MALSRHHDDILKLQPELQSLRSGRHCSKKDPVIFYCCGLQVVRQAVTVEMHVIVAALASAQTKMPLSSKS